MKILGILSLILVLASCGSTHVYTPQASISSPEVALNYINSGKFSSFGECFFYGDKFTRGNKTLKYENVYVNTMPGFGGNVSLMTEPDSIRTSHTLCTVFRGKVTSESFGSKMSGQEMDELITAFKILGVN